MRPMKDCLFHSTPAVLPSQRSGGGLRPQEQPKPRNREALPAPGVAPQAGQAQTGSETQTDMMPKPPGIHDSFRSTP